MGYFDTENFCAHCRNVRPISKNPTQNPIVGWCDKARDPVEYRWIRCEDVRKEYPVNCPEFESTTKETT